MVVAAGVGQIAWRVAVDLESGLLFSLGLVDGGIGGAVDEPGGLFAGEEGL